MSFLWNFVYWGSLVHGTLLAKFYSKFWTSGHFSVCGKVKHSLKVSDYYLKFIATFFAHSGWSHSNRSIWINNLLFCGILGSLESFQSPNPDFAKYF